MAESLDALLADVESFYPGSKRKRRSTAEPKSRAPKDLLAWDARPYKKPLPNGKEIELFTVGALAKALDRPFSSLKVWNENGYLPTSPYRLPTVKNARGENQKGRRLYSREMIEKTIEIFTRHGLIGIPRIEWSKLREVSLEIAASWSEIKDKEMNH